MENKNVYLKMTIERVREDTLTGVSSAKRDYAEREPEKAAEIGIGINADIQRKRMQEKQKSTKNIPAKQRKIKPILNLWEQEQWKA